MSIIGGWWWWLKYGLLLNCVIWWLLLLLLELFVELLAIEEDDEEVEVNKLSIEKLDFLLIGDLMLLFINLFFDSFVDIIEDDVSGDEDDGEARFSFLNKKKKSVMIT